MKFDVGGPEQSEYEAQRGVRLQGHALILMEKSDQKERATFFLSANRNTKVQHRGTC